MKRGITTANAIIVAVIIIGSIFAINLFSSLSGVEDISGDVVSSVGGFCGTKQIKTIFGTTKTYTYTCPSGSSCVNSVCKAITPPPTTTTPTNTIINPNLRSVTIFSLQKGTELRFSHYQYKLTDYNKDYLILGNLYNNVEIKIPYGKTVTITPTLFPDISYPWDLTYLSYTDQGIGIHAKGLL